MALAIASRRGAQAHRIGSSGALVTGAYHVPFGHNAPAASVGSGGLLGLPPWRARRTRRRSISTGNGRAWRGRLGSSTMLIVGRASTSISLITILAAR